MSRRALSDQRILCNTTRTAISETFGSPIHVLSCVVIKVALRMVKQCLRWSLGLIAAVSLYTGFAEPEDAIPYPAAGRSISKSEPQFRRCLEKWTGEVEVRKREKEEKRKGRRKKCLVFPFTRFAPGTHIHPFNLQKTGRCIFPYQEQI